MEYLSYRVKQTGMSVSDADAHWLVAVMYTNAGQFCELLSTLYDGLQNPVGWEIFLKNKRIQFHFSATPADVGRVKSAIHVIMPEAEIEQVEDTVDQFAFKTGVEHENSPIIGVEVGKSSVQTARFYTYKMWNFDLIAPPFNYLTLLPSDRVVLYQVVSLPRAQDVSFYAGVHTSSFMWRLGAALNPRIWLQRHRWKAFNKEVADHDTIVFNACIRFCIGSTLSHEGLPKEESENLREELDKDASEFFRCINIKSRADLGQHNIRYAAEGPEALTPFRTRELKKSYILTDRELASSFFFTGPGGFALSESVNSKTLKPSGEMVAKLGAPTKEQGIGQVTYQGRRSAVALPPEIREGNIQILGRTGMGKTKLLEIFLCEDAQTDCFQMVLDSNGEMLADIHALMRETKRSVACLELTRAKNEHDENEDFDSLDLNPFGDLQKREQDKLVELLLQWIVKSGIEASSREGDFVNYLRELLSCLIEEDDLNALAVHELLASREEREEILSGEKYLSKQDEFQALEERFQHSFETLTEKLSCLRELGEFSCHSHVPYNRSDELIKQGRNGISETSSGWVTVPVTPYEAFIGSNTLVAKIPELSFTSFERQLISSLLTLLMSFRADKFSHMSHILYIDEFHKFGSLAFGELARDHASKNLASIIAHQSNLQLGESLGKIMTTLFPNRLCFQMSAGDGEGMQEGFGGQLPPEEFRTLSPRCFHADLSLSGFDRVSFSGRTRDLHMEPASSDSSPHRPTNTTLRSEVSETGETELSQGR